MISLTLNLHKFAFRSIENGCYNCLIMQWQHYNWLLHTPCAFRSETLPVMATIAKSARSLAARSLAAEQHVPPRKKGIYTKMKLFQTFPNIIKCKLGLLQNESQNLPNKISLNNDNLEEGIHRS